MAFSTCYVKNISGSLKTYVGQELQPGQEYQIEDNERTNWIYSDVVIAAIVNGDILIGNGSVYFSSYHDQLSCLRSDLVVVSNFGPTDELGIPSVVAQKPTGTSLSISSHNFCDPCTWFGQSVRVTDETLTLESGTTYSSLHNYWIDLDHGRHYGEDQIKSSYLPVIKIDDVTVTTGFTINFEQGQVTFDSAPSGTVTASYSYATGSRYTLQPPPGHQYTLEHTEVNFSVPTNITSQIVFEIWAYNPYDLPNKVKVHGFKYKSAKDFVCTSNLGQGVISAFGELTQDIIVLPYNYGCSSALLSSQGVEVRVYLHDDTPLADGELGVVTFYVKVNAE